MYSHSQFACKHTRIGTAISLETTVANIVSPCPQCDIVKKSGLFSCCARGGAWFKNCGDPGDESFAHTWDEGIDACSNSPLPNAGLAQRIEPQHKTVSLRTNVDRYQISESALDIDFVSCEKLAEYVVFISVMLVILNV